jgi:hypothetical protein
VQDRVGDEVRGRVLSVYAMILSGTGPPGGLLAAALASAGGAPLSLAVGGGVSVACTLALTPFFLMRLGVFGSWQRDKAGAAASHYAPVASKTDRAG